MSITRWDPWSEAMSLREAMDSLLQESVVRPRGPGRGEGRFGGMGLALDVEERGEEFVITAPIPGMKPENVDISVLGDTLHIRAERQEERREEGEGQRWLLREQRYGAFERMLTLPSTIKGEQATAEFADGILTITLPKAEEAKTKRISVQARTREEQAVPIEADAKRSDRSGKSRA
jgi:HSP20 family protein